MGLGLRSTWGARCSSTPAAQKIEIEQGEKWKKRQKGLREKKIKKYGTGVDFPTGSKVIGQCPDQALICSRRGREREREEE